MAPLSPSTRGSGRLAQIREAGDLYGLKRPFLHVAHYTPAAVAVEFVEVELRRR